MGVRNKIINSAELLTRISSLMKSVYGKRKKDTDCEFKKKGLISIHPEWTDSNVRFIELL